MLDAPADSALVIYRLSLLQGAASQSHEEEFTAEEGVNSPESSASLQLSQDCVLPGRFVPRHAEHIGLAAHLAILDVGLLRPGRGINGGLVPLSAPRALEA